MFNLKKSNKIFYISEDKDWVIKRIGDYLKQNITNQNNIDFRVKNNLGYIRNKIIHFGSRSIYLPDKFKKVHKSNKIIFTWYHGTPEDRVFIDALPMGSKRADFIHTSCQISKRQLIALGAEEEKLVVIPIGFDSSCFRPLSQEEKRIKRHNFAIEDNYIVIKSVAAGESAAEPFVLKFRFRGKHPAHATLLGVMEDDGSVKVPAVLHIPGQGTLRITGSSASQAPLRLGYQGTREDGTITFLPGRRKTDGLSSSLKWSAYTLS